MPQANTSKPRLLSHLGHGAVVLLVGCCSMLSSCASPSVSLRALAPVNLNPDGESLPVKVRIYALRDDARFRAAPFADLWTKDREVLGDDRLQDPKVVIVPPASLKNAPQLVELSELPKEARFLGIVALIQHADQPDRRRAVISRKDIDAQLIELVDSSILMHDRGEPVPGRTAPRDEQPAAPLAAQPAVAAPAKPAASPAASPAAGPVASPAVSPAASPAANPAASPAASPVANAPSSTAAAAGSPSGGAGTPGSAAPRAATNFATKPGTPAASSGRPAAERGRGSAGQGQ